MRKSPAYELTFYHDAATPDSLLSWFERETKYREQNRLACLAELRREAKWNVDEEKIKELARPGPRDEE